MNNEYNAIQSFNETVKNSLDDYEFNMMNVQMSAKFLSSEEITSRRVRLEQIVTMLSTMELYNQ